MSQGSVVAFRQQINQDSSLDSRFLQAASLGTPGMVDLGEELGHHFSEDEFDSYYAELDPQTLTPIERDAFLQFSSACEELSDSELELVSAGGSVGANVPSQTTTPRPSA